MANYDNKLSEWFKQVEEGAKQLKAKKSPSEPEAKPVVEQTMQREPERVQSVMVESLVREAQASAVATIVAETRAVVAEPRREPEPVSRDEGTSEPRVIEPPRMSVSDVRPAENRPPAPRPAPALFDDSDVPQVEDFFSFLSHTSEPREVVQEEPRPMVSDEPRPLVEEIRPTVDIPQTRGIGHFSEGTGDPRPIPSDRSSGEASAPARVEAPKPAPRPVVQPRPQAARPARPVDQQPDLQEKWDRMPHHLQTLFGVANEGVAQNSYKAFKESRGELIQRLLDPPITLEEAARVLNVCPTTVRRYTNRGVLRHFRTAGNQRRFRLSDVLTFMESNGRRGKAGSEVEE